MRNLFTRVHDLRHGTSVNGVGSGWEDTLTDAMAFFLASDREALDAWMRQLLGADAEPVSDIETQWVDGADRPDLAFHLASGGLVLLENKAGAALQDRQLERYLALRGRDGRPARVAFMALRPRSLAVEVLEHRRYLRPASADHFLWQDFYRSIPASEDALGVAHLRRSMRAYLRWLGLSPSTLVGRWTELTVLPPTEESKPIRREFGRRLGGVRQLLAARGHRVTAVLHAGLQGVPSRRGVVRHLAVSPERVRPDVLPREAESEVVGEVLRVALVFQDRAAEAEVRGVAERLPTSVVTADGARWWATRPYLLGHGRFRIDVVTRLDRLLQEEHGIDVALTSAVSGLLPHLEQAVPHLSAASG